MASRSQRRRARRQMDRLREQVRVCSCSSMVAGEFVRELRAARAADAEILAALVCALLEADEQLVEARASLARMTGRFAGALQRVRELEEGAGPSALAAVGAR